MGYERLPLDVLSHIVLLVVAAEHPEDSPYTPSQVYRYSQWYNGKPSLTNYACVSRWWQTLVEPHTFGMLRISSGEDLDRFREIFAGNHRRGLLRHLTYIINLPEYSENRRQRFETKQEKLQNNTAFDQAITELFQVLNTWECRGTSAGDANVNSSRYQRLGLSIQTRCETDKHTEYDRERNRDEGLGALRSAKSIINFPDNTAKVLPIISIVEDFTHEGKRIVDFNVFRTITSAMPRLRYLELNFLQPPMKYVAARREQWHELGQLVDILAQSASLKSLSLNSYFTVPDNRSFDPGDMRQPTTSIDYTSLALHKLSMGQDSTLQRLALEGCFLISPQLFWPYGNEDDDHELGQNLLSSNLEYVEIACSLRNPEGKWYYTGNPGSIDRYFERGFDWEREDNHLESDSSDSDASCDSSVPASLNNARENIRSGCAPTHRWRLEPDRAIFEPLLKAMARAALHLSRLKHLFFMLGRCYMYNYEVIGITYAVAGELLKEPWFEHTQCTATTRTCLVWYGKDMDWTLPEEIEGMMKEWVGQEGVVAKVTWPWPGWGGEDLEDVIRRFHYS